MALTAVTFRTRALTSLVFVAVMLAGLLWNTWSFFILFSIIHFGCWYEYQKLLARIDPAYAEISGFQKYGVMVAGWCIMMYCSSPYDGDMGDAGLHNAGLYGGLLFLFILPVAEILYTRKTYLRNMGYSMLGLIYISLSLGLLLNLRTYYHYPGGPLQNVNKLLVLAIILSLWVNDTMAYLIGSLIGKTPLTKISPKKTWEGTIGGIIFAILTMGAVGYFLNSSGFEMQNATQWMIVAAIAAITGTVGDLLQSKLKRLADVKDSGHIMPGHGGFLDRFDSLLFATPFIWLYIVMFA
jgi:phosphatidate cytidylyltransferase